MLFDGPLAPSKPKYAPRGNSGLNVPSVVLEFRSPLVAPTPKVSSGRSGSVGPRNTVLPATVHAEIDPSLARLSAYGDFDLPEPHGDAADPFCWLIGRDKIVERDLYGRRGHFNRKRSAEIDPGRRCCCHRKVELRFEPQRLLPFVHRKFELCRGADWSKHRDRSLRCVRRLGAR